MKADLILTNGKVLTMDAARPRAEAVAVAAGRIVAVGGGAEIAALAGPRTRVIEVGGRSVLPGFVESHMHLGLGGAGLTHLQLGGVSGGEALRAAFEAHAASHEGMVLGEGGGYGMIGKPMTRADLDAIAGDRPFAIRSADQHTVWANTAALTAAGLSLGRDLPAGHRVVMGPDGRATGELLEFEAFTPILEMAGVARINLGIATGEEPDPPPTPEERAVDKAHLSRGLAHVAAQGVTTVVNMDGNRYTLDLLSELEAEGNLPARVVVPFHFKPHMDISALERASAMARDFAAGRVRSGFVKMFMDGVIDSRTACMLAPYPGSERRGTQLFAPDLFAEICTEIDRRGLQIAVHAIGDGAVRATIDGYEAARKANGARDSRHRIEHIELIDRTDVPRLGALGITASLQPAHPPGAMDFPLSGMDPVARARWKDAFLCRTLSEAGAPVAFASDWPVADVSVMRGLQAARMRRPYDAICSDERLSRQACLRAYTAGGAWAAHLEGETGRLVPGLAGDLVVIDGDIEAIPDSELGAAGIVLTVAAGRITHQAKGIG